MTNPPVSPDGFQRICFEQGSFSANGQKVWKAIALESPVNGRIECGEKSLVDIRKTVATGCLGARRTMLWGGRRMDERMSTNAHDSVIARVSSPKNLESLNERTQKEHGRIRGT